MRREFVGKTVRSPRYSVGCGGACTFNRFRIALWQIGHIEKVGSPAFLSSLVRASSVLLKLTR